MSPHRDACRDQVNRLACLIGFPSEPRARAELLDTLLAAAFDDRHAKAITDAWLESARFAPTPADLRALARATRPHEAKSTFGCAVCGGTGWVYSIETNTVRRCACLCDAIAAQRAATGGATR